MCSLKTMPIQFRSCCLLFAIVTRTFVNNSFTIAWVRFTIGCIVPCILWYRQDIFHRPAVVLENFRYLVSLNRVLRVAALDLLNYLELLIAFCSWSRICHRFPIAPLTARVVSCCIINGGSFYCKIDCGSQKLSCAMSSGVWACGGDYPLFD